MQPLITRITSCLMFKCSQDRQDSLVLYIQFLSKSAAKKKSFSERITASSQKIKRVSTFLIVAPSTTIVGITRLNTEHRAPIWRFLGAISLFLALCPRLRRQIINFFSNIFCKSVDYLHFSQNRRIKWPKSG